VRWLGFSWDDRPLLASDYFEQLYAFAVQLIKKGKATSAIGPDEVRKYREPANPEGQPFSKPFGRGELGLLPGCGPGNSPTVPHPAGKMTWPSPNLNLRDPVMYRIMHAETTHGHGGASTMYDFTTASAIPWKDHIPSAPGI